MSDPKPRQRLDKWLWQARFYKTRTLAAKEVSAGHVRLNGDKVSKPATPISPGDVLTFARGARVWVVEIAALGTRRGPAPEAQALYVDRSPAHSPEPPRVGARPTGRDRRKIDALKTSSLE